MRKYLGPAVAAIVGALGVLYFYRAWFLTGFNAFQGDLGDGRMTAYVINFWSHPFQFGGPTELGFFYPIPDILGYSEAMLVNGVLTAPFLLLKMDALQSVMCGLTLLSSLGYLGWVLWLRKAPRLPWPITITAAAILSFGNSQLEGAHHLQLIDTAVIPAVLLSVHYASKTSSRVRRTLWSAAAGFFYMSLAMSAFYVFWAFTLAVGIAGLVWLVLHRKTLAVKPLTLLQPVTGFVVGTLPLAALFIATYLPMFLSGAKRSISEAYGYAVTWQELLNPGSHNILWGPLADALGWTVSGSGDEGAMSPTPLVFLVAVVVTVLGLRRRYALSGWGTIGLSSALSGFVLWLAPAQLGSFFVWQIFHTIPGAAAIRAVGRIEIMATAALVVGTALLSADLMRGLPMNKRKISAGILAVCLLLGAEQLSTHIQQRFDHSRQSALAALPAAPQVCESFVVTSPYGSHDPEWGITQTDALTVAELQGIPTWNGYTSAIPQGWGGRTEALDNWEARKWMQLHPMRNACGLDLANRRWLEPAELNALFDNLGPEPAPLTAEQRVEKIKNENISGDISVK